MARSLAVHTKRTLESPVASRVYRMLPVLAALAWIGLISPPATAADPVATRFASLRADEVNLRTGPGVRYPVDWVYRRRQLPVEIVANFENWRKIRDWQGTEGWVHQSMLSTNRHVMITGEIRVLQRRPIPGSIEIARLEPGVIGALRECEGDWCEVEVAGLVGWLKKTDFWGGAGETARK